MSLIVELEFIINLIDLQNEIDYIEIYMQDIEIKPYDDFIYKLLTLYQKNYDVELTLKYKFNGDPYIGHIFIPLGSSYERKIIQKYNFDHRDLYFL
jgi:hypothetical protein